MPDLPDPVLLAVPAFVMLVLAEMIYGRVTGKARFHPDDSWGSLMMGLGNTVSNALFGIAIGGLLIWTWQNLRLFDIPYAWWSWVLCFVLDDLLYYAFHRSAHRVRWFWASHVVHHSSQHYNLTTALRQTWSSPLSLAFLFRVPLMVLGFPPAMAFFCAGLNLIYQFWIHTEVIGRCPRWFEALMNTPSHHRVHHATNPRYLDANYAGVFILWDRLFGTFAGERDDDPCRYGLVHNLGTFNPLRIAVHEWVAIARDLLAARSWRDRWRFVSAPPGWSPDGSRATTDQIKARWRERTGTAALDG